MFMFISAVQVAPVSRFLPLGVETRKRQQFLETKLETGRKRAFVYSVGDGNEQETVWKRQQFAWKRGGSFFVVPVSSKLLTLD